MSGQTTHLRRLIVLTALATLTLPSMSLLAADDLRDTIAPQPPTEADAITIRADFSQEWTADSERIAVLRGQCRIAQGNATISANKMVVWQRADSNSWAGREQLIVYLEGTVRVDRPGRTLTDSSMLIRLVTRSGVTKDIRRSLSAPPADGDPLYQRAQKQRSLSQRNTLTQTQLVVSEQGDTGPELRSAQLEPQRSNLRRIRIFPRSAVPLNVLSRRSEATTPPEQIWILTRGVNVLIDGVNGFGTVDLAADRVVIWTQADDVEEFRSETVQPRETPFQVYLEGNIVIRQGQNVLRADRAFYDAREDRALLLDAEIKAFIPELQGNLRVRAEWVRQRSQNSFQAHNAWTSTSRFGKPGYRLQASDVFLDQRLTPPFRFGATTVDPATGAPIVEETPWVESLNNTFFIDDMPLLYAPRLSGPAEDPNVPIRSVNAGYDRIFGGRLKTAWDLFRLAGLEKPAGTNWDLLVDGYTARGPAAGTAVDYQGTDLFGIPGSYFGEGLAYYVLDDGQDNLGSDRKSLRPESNDRYRLYLRHRQNLPNNVAVFGELGLLSDRNFLEQYYENEFDEGKDNETLLYAKQHFESRAWTLLVRPQVNDFAATTEWLPRGDVYVLSEPLFDGRLTWSTHTSAGFGKLRPSDAPSDPTDLFTPLPFVANVGGAVLMSRHEFDVPLSFGPIQLVPYVLGEAAFWSEDFTGDELDRFVGSGGVRSSLLFWRVFPYVQSRIFNLHGLAHKIRLETEYAWTGSTEDLSSIPQYNEFDDNAQERFRRRLLVNTFGGVLPPMFEPRFYAVRTGAGRTVTAPYHELVDDQQVLRMALRQRWQTKVGPPDRLRIKDWMTIDLEASWFPNADRDNFGEDFGLIGARYAWHVGERTSLLANTFYDLFDDAQQLWNVAVLSQRSRRGSVYLGVRQVKGAGLDSQILTTSYTYKMSPKWISTFGTAFDLKEDQNRGQSLTITRIGADFLVHVGANFDASKNNAGIALSVEPRFGPFTTTNTQLSSLLGPP